LPQEVKRCVNYFQVVVGAVGACLGAAPTVEGAAEAVSGVGLTPETLAADLLLTGKGVVDMGTGALAARDGMLLMETGWSGVQRGSTLGQIGEQAGGHFGGTAGEAANYALSIKGVLDAAKTGNPIGLAFGLNIGNKYRGKLFDAMSVTFDPVVSE
jgi:hypothetical protein